MQCVILAGGLGTRMWPVAKTVPKTLLPVAGRPFAGWQLDWLAASGVSSVVYCIAYLGSQVRDFVGDGARWGLDVEYVDEGTQPRGTAGALALAAAGGVLADRFLVLYGDSWLRIDPADVLARSSRSAEPALMTVYENHGQYDRSNVVYADGKVLRYEKGLDPAPAEMRWIDYGLSVLTADLVTQLIPADIPADLAPVFTLLAREGQLAGYLAHERFYEIGSPDGLAEAEALLSSGQDLTDDS